MPALTSACPTTTPFPNTSPNINKNTAYGSKRLQVCVTIAPFSEYGYALVVRFLTRRFIWEYDPTLESTYRHQASIDDEVVTMEILDTAGQVRPECTRVPSGLFIAMCFKLHFFLCF
uniref:small monomeric GTPase n=1 Tax=Oryzias melastigma TaxID=30732 RepID=A0A3B3DT39_ORYME